MTLGELGSGAPLQQAAAPLLVYACGTCCAGKSTFLAAAKARYGPRAGFVEVGAEFRRRYPAGYFRGQASPEHTRREALEIYDTLLAAALAEKPDFIFIDGQPRSEDQVAHCLAGHSQLPRLFIFFDAPQPLRLARAAARHPGWQAGGAAGDLYDLAVRRITHDDPMMVYRTVMPLLAADIMPRVVYNAGDTPAPACAKAFAYVEAAI